MQGIENSCPLQETKYLPRGCQLRRKENMDSNRMEELQVELNQLMKKQTQVLESRMFGVANDTELLEYEIREAIIHEICNQLANSRVN